MLCCTFGFPSALAGDDISDVAIATATDIAANDAVTIDLKQVLVATNTVKTHASATTVNFHISGLEIS